MASTNPNKLKNVLPGAGTSFAVDGSTEIAQLSVDTACLAALSVTSAKLAANAVTSGKLSADTIQVATVTLTPAQIKLLYTTAIQIVAAPGVGKTIVVHQALARLAYTAPAYTGGGAVQLQYDNTANAGGTTPLTTIPAATINGTASIDVCLQTAATTTTATQNKGIFASNATAVFATGTTSTLEITVWYSIK